jgi:hypothetical protein
MELLLAQMTAEAPGPRAAAASSTRLLSPRLVVRRTS